MPTTSTRSEDKMGNLEQSHQEFGKYDAHGAYHWKQMRFNLRRFNAGLAGRYEVSLSLLAQHCEAERIRAVVDIGCGDGYFTSRLATLFPAATVEGYDFSARGIELARKMCAHKNLHFIVGDAFDRYRDEQPNLVTATDVIEHIDDYRGFLRQCHALLADHGHLLISTPIRIKEHPDDPYHVHEFFQEELSAEISKCGFRVVQQVASHDYRILERYSKRYTFMGLGRMRLGKYHANFLSLVLGRNPFVGASARLPTMQYVLAERIDVKDSGNVRNE